VSAPVSGSLRIGAFSRKVGVSAAVLRAWESRYGLFDPDRTSGGYRLYGAEEERRVTRMRSLLARGMAAAESARVVLAEHRERDTRPALAEAWRSLDAEGA
jgi:MerR family transcriptional regulator, light-induced transcriptional regulator